MRTFDYRHLPRSLFDGRTGDANVRLYEDRGKLDMLQKVRGEQLAACRAAAHVDSVDASARIEGLCVDRHRVCELAGGAAPEGEVESQLVGYSNALRMIEDDPDGLELSASTIVRIYETLFAHRDLGRRSRYRKKDYMHVQVDGHVEAMPVSPITAFETPLVLGSACDSLAEAFVADACSPLILAAVFTVDFLCIRPFDEGNGRVARLFADLMLAKAGFGIARYASVDRIVERSAMAYYDALNGCVDKWDRAANDYTPYVLYWLDAVHAAHTGLFSRIDVRAGAGAGKSERVRIFASGTEDPFTKRQVLEALPDISEATVENVLGQMVKDGSLEKLGSGRGTSYRSA